MLSNSHAIDEMYHMYGTRPHDPYWTPILPLSSSQFVQQYFVALFLYDSLPILKSMSDVSFDHFSYLRQLVQVRDCE